MLTIKGERTSKGAPETARRPSEEPGRPLEGRWLGGVGSRKVIECGSHRELGGPQREIQGPRTG